MKQLPPKKSPFDPNQKKHVSDPAQSPAFQHRCPCKKNGAPECDCPHKGGCNLASACATASRSPSAITTTTATSTAHLIAPSKHLSTRNTVQSPALSPSAYSFGYDGSMSLSKVGALLMSIESGQLDTVSILNYLPQNLSRAFGGRVTQRKKRPKAVRVQKMDDTEKGKKCVCELKCGCRCWTLKSPVATGHSPIFDRDVIR